MPSRALSYAVVASLLSLAAAGWSAWMQVDTVGLLAARSVAQVAPVRVDVLPPDTQLPPAQPVLTTQERLTLNRALWRTPLSPALFNLFYADAVRAARAEAVRRHALDLLSRLGWRNTLAQQNLMLQAALDSDYQAVIDRSDALLRRQKLPVLSYALMSAMETLPQIQPMVIARLKARPPWRESYLAMTGPQTPEPTLLARIRTMDALIAIPPGMSRKEMAPSLAALTAIGHGRDAYRLWMRRSERGEAGNLLYDPSFSQAAAFTGTEDIGIPFEWRFAQDLGYAAQVSTGGVAINWDRRGVPTFLSQKVPVTPGERYMVSIQGRSEGAGLSSLLSPAILCGNVTVLFTRAKGGAGEAFYRSEPLPASCDMGTLAVNGALDSGTGVVDMIITRVALRRAN